MHKNSSMHGSNSSTRGRSTISAAHNSPKTSGFDIRIPIASIRRGDFSMGSHKNSLRRTMEPTYMSTSAIPEPVENQHYEKLESGSKTAALDLAFSPYSSMTPLSRAKLAQQPDSSQEDPHPLPQTRTPEASFTNYAPINTTTSLGATAPRVPPPFVPPNSSKPPLKFKNTSTKNTNSNNDNMNIHDQIWQAPPPKEKTDLPGLRGSLPNRPLPRRQAPSIPPQLSVHHRGQPNQSGGVSAFVVGNVKSSQESPNKGSKPPTLAESPNKGSKLPTLAVPRLPARTSPSRPEPTLTQSSSPILKHNSSQNNSPNLNQNNSPNLSQNTLSNMNPESSSPPANFNQNFNQNLPRNSRQDQYNNKNPTAHTKQTLNQKPSPSHLTISHGSPTTRSATLTTGPPKIPPKTATLNRPSRPPPQRNESSRSMTISSPPTGVKHSRLPPTPNEIEYLTKLGHGAFGEVWKCRWKDQTVAVKKVITEKVSSDDIHNFVDEAKIMRSIPYHINVCTFIGFIATPPSIVTEFVEKGALENILTSDLPLLDRQKMCWMSDIASGMAHLEEARVVHKDLAARNVLVGALNEAKVSDFGMSRPISEGNHIYSSSTLGPIRWMAPESLSKSKYSHKSDVWAFGVTCTEILTRQLPYPNLTNTAVVAAVFTSTKCPVLETLQSCDPKLVSILEKCLEKDSNDRPSFVQVTEMFQSLKKD